MNPFEDRPRRYCWGVWGAWRVAGFGFCAGVALAAAGPAALAQDAYESNNTRATATGLGANPNVWLDNLIIHNGTDEDFFRLTAPFTGVMAVDMFFIHSLGDLDMVLQDLNGRQVAVSNGVTATSASRTCSICSSPRTRSAPPACSRRLRAGSTPRPACSICPAR